MPKHIDQGRDADFGSSEQTLRAKQHDADEKYTVDEHAVLIEIAEETGHDIGEDIGKQFPDAS
jgi:hypothetical protein